MQKWYVMQTKPRKELFLVGQLQENDIMTYFPYLHVKRVNPRARKFEPFYPGYIFIKTDLDKVGVATLQWTPGVKGLVEFGGEYATVEERYLLQLRQKIELINSERGEVAGTRYMKGDKVRVQSGIFSGHEGIFDSTLPGGARVRLLLKWLSDRFVRVEIPVEDIS